MKTDAAAVAGGGDCFEGDGDLKDGEEVGGDLVSGGDLCIA